MQYPPVNDSEFVKRLVKHVKPNALIQGGAFRLDKGPTNTELRTFKLAVLLHEECRKNRTKTEIGCMVNDFGIAPELRPRFSAESEVASYRKLLSRAYIKTSIEVWASLYSIPKPYLDFLRKHTLIPPACIATFQETYLRNRASEDDVSSLRMNDETGFRVPVCASIMGRFYHELARRGYTQQIGFYAQEPRPDDDKACPIGPIKGADKKLSGYELQIDVLNYWVYQDGRIALGGFFQP
jgi:hypothetical protein